MNNEREREEISSTQALREYVNRQSSSTTILAALGAVLDAQVTGEPLDPTLQARIDEVLEALGMHIVESGSGDLKYLLAEIRFNMLLDTKLLYSVTGAGGRRSFRYKRFRSRVDSQRLHT